MNIAVDFDGTVVEHRYPEIGKEIPFAIENLKKLAADGHRLILWTAREGHLLEEAVAFCKSKGLEFYAINADLPNANWASYKTTRKLRADCFIDDRNLGGLPDWSTIYMMISRRMTFGDMINEGYEEPRRKGFFRRLRERSMASRERLTHSSRHHRSGHHW